MDKLGKIRVIGGEWRGRKLPVPDKQGLRPTPDRVRETLFNWLAYHLPNSRCLDLFAGSGALGIEAASRGAKHVLLVEQDHEVVQNLKQQIAIFKTDKIQIIQDDTLQFLKKTPIICDIVFLDPPFHNDLLEPCCQLLETQGWLAPTAHVYLEMERNLGKFALPANWQIIRQQTAGQVAYCLVVRTFAISDMNLSDRT